VAGRVGRIGGRVDAAVTLEPFGVGVYELGAA
jgi:hypothetical protein